jgi:hypothetical protein
MRRVGSTIHLTPRDARLFAHVDLSAHTQREAFDPTLHSHLTSVVRQTRLPTPNQQRLSDTPERREDNIRPACIVPHRLHQKL